MMSWCLQLVLLAMGVMYLLIHLLCLVMSPEGA
jgi:hypothetical protein